MARRRYRPERFTVTLPDGRKAKCERLINQDYENCRFSAGKVTGLPPEDVYFMSERPYDDDPRMYFIRKDEALAMAWCIIGSLWSVEIDAVPVGGKGRVG